MYKTVLTIPHMVSSYYGKLGKYSFENRDDWISDLKVIRTNYYGKGKKGEIRYVNEVSVKAS